MELTPEQQATNCYDSHFLSTNNVRYGNGSRVRLYSVERNIKNQWGETGLLYNERHEKNVQ